MSCRAVKLGLAASQRLSSHDELWEWLQWCSMTKEMLEYGWMPSSKEHGPAGISTKRLLGVYLSVCNEYGCQTESYSGLRTALGYFNRKCVCLCARNFILLADNAEWLRVGDCVPYSLQYVLWIIDSRNPEALVGRKFDFFFSFPILQSDAHCIICIRSLMITFRVPRDRYDYEPSPHVQEVWALQCTWCSTPYFL